MFKLIFAFLLLLSNFSYSIDLISNNDGKLINKIEINGIKYINFYDIKSSISSGTIWFSDRNKLIVTLKNSEKIIFTVDNQFVAYKGKNYNLIYKVKRGENGEILIPYITFINLLSDLFKNIVKFDKQMSTIEFLFKDTLISNISYTNKDNGSIISIKVPKKTLLDYTIINNSLNINFYEKKLDEKSIKNGLEGLERLKNIKIFNFKNSSQLTFIFKTLKEKPKFLFKKDDNTITIILRAKKINYSYKKDNSKDKKRDKEKKIDMSLKRKTNHKFTVVIDAGHGGKDPGAIGYNGTKEKRIALDVAKKLKETFKKDDINVILTRDTDKFIKLKNRAKIANDNHADLFISLHCNSIGGSTNRRKKIQGFTTYFLSPAKTNDARAVAMFENGSLKYENDDKDKRKSKESSSDLDFIVNDVIQTKFLDESNFISKSILKSMNKHGIKKTHGTGISQAGFYVLKKTYMPSILVEMGFVSNPTEEKKLNLKKYREKIAKSLRDAIMIYKGKYYE